MLALAATLLRVVFQLFEEESGGSRPPSLGEPRGPQEEVLRHTVKQMADVFPFVQILDALVPQLGNQLLEVSRLFGLWSPSRLSTGPKISQDMTQQRPADRDLRHSQMAEQLVEVPTVLSPSVLQQRRLLRRSSTVQFRVVVGVQAVEVFKVFPQDRFQQRHPHFLALRMRRLKFFFFSYFAPKQKKCGVWAGR